MKTEQEIRDEVRHLRKRGMTMAAYAESRMEIADRHGVQDAMSDLREIEAAIAALDWVLGDRTDIGR